MITIIAFLTMVIDHIWYIFFPWDMTWRIIGRISFPLFAWWIVRGYRMTRNKEKYAKRIFYLAVISQIPVLFLFWENLYNVCFTLLFWLISIFLIDQKDLNKIIRYLIIIILLLIAQLVNFDYWIYWILTIILIHLFWQQKKVVIPFSIITFMFYCVDFNTLTFWFSIQLYSILSFFLLYFTNIQKYDFKLNFYIKYWFYPVHLALLYLVKVLIK